MDNTDQQVDEMSISWILAVWFESFLLIADFSGRMMII